MTNAQALAYLGRPTLHNRAPVEYVSLLDPPHVYDAAEDIATAQDVVQDASGFFDEPFDDE